MLTVVIPTYNRCQTLRKALAEYQRQSARKEILEIIVVDDGSTDSTRDMVLELADNSAVPIRYLRQENRGPAAARNLGIREVTSPIILFTDDDIIPGNDVVAEHAAWHRRYTAESVAVLGYVTWAPNPQPTPFMRWCGEEGPLFAYRRFRGKQELDYRFFYTCNLSLKTRFIRDTGQFDEEFKIAAWEDIEFGYRLSKAGLRLLYNPRAIGYHEQFFLFDDICRKAEATAAARRVFLRKEAGTHFIQERKQRESQVGFRIAERLAGMMSPALVPLTFLLDSKVRLPSIVYRWMYWHHLTRRWPLLESTINESSHRP
jgi:glycosyltransferase involved in cell wall biosynthesis